MVCHNKSTLHFLILIIKWRPNASLLTAIGTLVLASLTFIIVVQNIYRPALEISVIPKCRRILFMKEDEKVIANMPIKTALKADGYLLLISIKNKSKWYHAKSVEIFATKLHRKTQSGTFIPCEDFDPSNLEWSHHEKTFFFDLSPGMERYCYIGLLIDPKLRKYFPFQNREDLNLDNMTTSFSFASSILRFTKIHVIPPGTYRLDCIIGGSNTKAYLRSFCVYISGEWFGTEQEMNEKGLTISFFTQHSERIEDYNWAKIWRDVPKIHI